MEKIKKTAEELEQVKVEELLPQRPPFIMIEKMLEYDEEKNLTSTLYHIASDNPFDVADLKSVDAAITSWSSAHPDDYIAVLVNNAGIRKDTLMMWMEDEDWSSVINTHLNGFFYVTRKVQGDMLKKRWGRIVSVASLSGIKGMPGQTNYSAAKGGIIAATKALALEVAKRGVTVNAVAPGFVETDMTKELDENTLKNTIPAGRFGRAEEVADLVAFLVSDKAAYITGQVIEINGGLNT